MKFLFLILFSAGLLCGDEFAKTYLLAEKDWEVAMEAEGKFTLSREIFVLWPVE